MLHASVLIPRLYLLLPIIAAAAVLLQYRITKSGNAFRDLLVTAIGAQWGD